MQAELSSHEDLTKHQIMDAAIRCIAEKGVDKTRIGDIAKEQGLARQTIYNYFSNKNELMNATFSRAALSLAENTRAHITQFSSLDDKFIEAVMYALEHFPKNPVLSEVMSSGGQFLLEFGVSRQTMQAFGEMVLQDIFKEHPFLQQQAEEICEFVSRNIISFLIMPDQQPRPENELRAFVRRRIIPGLALR